MSDRLVPPSGNRRLVNQSHRERYWKDAFLLANSGFRSIEGLLGRVARAAQSRHTTAALSWLACALVIIDNVGRQSFTFRNLLPGSRLRALPSLARGIYGSQKLRSKA